MGWFGLRRLGGRPPLPTDKDEDGPAGDATIPADGPVESDRLAGGGCADFGVPALAVNDTDRSAGAGRRADPPPAGPYADGDEHLRDELTRIAHLVRAATLRWRSRIAAHKPEHLWGMPLVGDGEADAALGAPFAPDDGLPDETAAALDRCRTAAAAVSERIAARQRATPATIDLRLHRLQAAFGLFDLDRDILLVCLLPELNGRYRRLFGYLQDDASRDRPTVELVMQVLTPEIRDFASARPRFSATAPLFAPPLLTANADADAETPLSMRLLRVDDRIVDFLLGADAIDSRLAALGARLVPPLAWEALVAEPEVVRQLRRLAEGCRERRRTLCPPPIVLLLGVHGSGRLDAARALCGEAGMPLLVCDVERMLSAPGGWERTVALCSREATLQGAGICWLGCGALLETGQPAHYGQRLIDAVLAFPGPSFLAGESGWEPYGRFRDRPLIRLDLPVPAYDGRRRLWTAQLSATAGITLAAEAREPLAELLAEAFRLTPGQIADAAAAARWLALGRDGHAAQPSVDDLFESCRRQSSRRLLGFARRIEPHGDLGFDDLVVPPASRRQLDELRRRVRLRSGVYGGLGFERRLSLGRGLVALFTGSSGTGKTMAAELLAREQRVDLYKIDMSAVVSKWVGETEKNLARVFDEAEDANAILLFDEADALFGRRGEVKQAQDRWANMECNFLLQRVEEYAGTVVLTSNLRQNIDEAFLRRIHVVVDFPFPDADARTRILEGLFPAGVAAPETAALRQLADRFKLAGGNFKNIVVDAAFRALATANGGVPAVSLRHLVVATGREYQKLGKPITKSEFSEPFYGWLEEDIL